MSSFPILGLKLARTCTRTTMVTTKTHGLLSLGSSVSVDLSRKSSTSSDDVKDPKTHTGQAFAPTDYRLARFVDKEKQINPRFAIDLIAQVEPKADKASVVCCDGGGGPLGHPKVYINLDQPGNHSCGYCGLRFYKDGHGGHSSH